MINISTPWSSGISEKRKSTFTQNDGTAVPAEFLCFSGNFPFLETDKYTAAALRCGIRDELQLVVMLPHNHITSAFMDMTNADIQYLDQCLSPKFCHVEKISVELPTFEIDRLCDLGSNVKDIRALRRVVSHNNRLTGMGPEHLILDGIVQRHYMKVDACGINAQFPAVSIDIEISETRPFTITRVGYIRDSSYNLQGSLGYSNEIICSGHVVVAIDGEAVDGLPAMEHPRLLLRGANQSLVNIVLVRKDPEGRQKVFAVTLLRDTEFRYKDDGCNDARKKLCLNRPFFLLLKDIQSATVISICLGFTLSPYD